MYHSIGQAVFDLSNLSQFSQLHHMPGKNTRSHQKWSKLSQQKPGAFFGKFLSKSAKHSVVGTFKNHL
jgi:hypothetical protein